MKKIPLTVLIIFLLVKLGVGQVTVTNPGNTIPGLAANYPSLSAAISALNGITAISGPVTITLNAATPQTAPAGGYVIQFSAATTAINNITINGSNNIITAFTPQTSGNLNDAIFKFIGADHITLQNFIMQEHPSNATTAAAVNNMTEWGIAFLKASTTDGCQHNTIQNNTISLNRTYSNTFGIYSNARHTAASITATTDIANNNSGPHSGNKIYGNNISNVNMGITFIGTGTTGANQDVGNDIGGNSASTGNNITNWGGAAAASGYSSNSAASYCIYVNNQTNENVSYNTMTSAPVSGTAVTFTGISKDYSASQPVGTVVSNITYNTITMSSAFASGNFECIRSQGLTTLATASIHITNNNLLNNAITGAGSTCAFGGIINTSVPGTLNITNNVIRGLTTTSSGGFTGISNSGDVVNTINITNNQVGNAMGGAVTYSVASASPVNCIANTGGAATVTINVNNNSMDGLGIVTCGQLACIINTAAATLLNIKDNQLGTVTGNLVNFSGAQVSPVFPVYTDGTGAVSTVTIQGNDVRGIVHSVTASGAHQYFTSASAVLSVNISNNTITNITANTTGQVFCIFRGGAMAAGASFTCTGNSIVNGYTKSAAGNQFSFIVSQFFSVSGSAITVTGNNCSNVTVTGGTNVYPLVLSEGISSGSGPAKTITGNTISNITGGSGQQVSIWIDKSGPTTCSSNTISNISFTGNIFGIYYAQNNGAGTHTCAFNTINSLISSGVGGTVEGILGGNSVMTTWNVNNNSISGLSSTGAAVLIAGVEIDGGSTVNVNDNLINNLSGSGAAAPLAVGVVVFGGNTLKIFNNKINSISLTGALSGPGPYLDGILFDNGSNCTAYNNFISDLTMPNANSTLAIAGIEISSIIPSSAYNLYYNSIYLNAGSAGTNFGTRGVYAAASSSATTAALKMINNIIVNTSTPRGAGVTAAYGRTIPTLTNFSTASNNNLFYAGSPASNRLIYYDGFNSDQTLAAYKARVSTRDANSISVMPVFTSATDLHVTPANCAIESKGIPVAGIAGDIDADTRSVTGPDIGADEFDAYDSGVLAGIAGAAVCSNKAVANTGTTYIDGGCNIIARVLPSGGNPVTGLINACVTRDASQLYFNGEPYVQRHYDIEPAVSNQTTTSATITLYFNNAEFILYNANNPAWPQLPTSAGDPKIANVKVTQFHGTPNGGLPTTTPGNYTGLRVLLIPSSVVLNGSIWEVTINVAGFSGFYVHTNYFGAPLPVTINYFTGTKQGSNHLLNWKVTCNSTPGVTMTLERGADSRNFIAINTITADAVRCNQPFDHTDTDPLKGMNYYRLKVEDAAGKIYYSGIVALLNAVKGFEMISIAPNPVVNDNFTLNVTSAQASKMELTIFDLQGRLVNRQSVSLIAGFNSLPLNVGKLAKGSYLLQGIMEDERSGVIRFVKL